MRSLDKVKIVLAGPYSKGHRPALEGTKHRHWLSGGHPRFRISCRKTFRPRIMNGCVWTRHAIAGYTSTGS